jgi:hypothetical protein
VDEGRCADAEDGKGEIGDLALTQLVVVMGRV